MDYCSVTDGKEQNLKRGGYYIATISMSEICHKHIVYLVSCVRCSVKLHCNLKQGALGQDGWWPPCERGVRTMNRLLCLAEDGDGD